MSSKEMRAQIVTLLQDNSLHHPDSYPIYLTAAIVGWYFRDSPTGMATVNQLKVCNLVHLYIAALERDHPTDEVQEAHNIVHDLSLKLVEKLKAKGIISADDDGFIDDDELLESHKDDFSTWAEELSFKDEGK